ncbi:allA [Phaffia rhodozyma]|uniref:AllA n=1 Tax=Phaffia rhodozyma TaxID=264483 RepID=A0A0F7SYD5_PHARH|nr:allA [Phaffia rhodozyma]
MPINNTVPLLIAQPMTYELIEPYGNLIQGSWDPSTMPARIKTNVVPNPQTAYKYNRQAPIISTYPATSNAHTAIAIYRATPPTGINLARGLSFDLRMFERHSFSSQAFLPLARGTGSDSVGESEGGMVVIVALNGSDDKPDMSTLKAFLLEPWQGISYNAGVWHHSVLTLSPVDYACVDTQITQDSSLKADCEALRRGTDVAPWAKVYLPLRGEEITV